MADNDEGVDLLSDVIDEMHRVLTSNWKMNKGHERSNEYNWTHSENTCYAIENLKLNKYPSYYFEDWIPFLQDIHSGLMDVLKNKSFTNKAWRKNCEEYRDMIDDWIVKIRKEVD